MMQADWKNDCLPFDFCIHVMSILQGLHVNYIPLKLAHRIQTYERAKEDRH